MSKPELNRAFVWALGAHLAVVVAVLALAALGRVAGWDRAREVRDEAIGRATAEPAWIELGDGGSPAQGIREGRGQKRLKSAGNLGVSGQATSAQKSGDELDPLASRYRARVGALLQERARALGLKPGSRLSLSVSARPGSRPSLEVTSGVAGVDDLALLALTEIIADLPAPRGFSLDIAVLEDGRLGLGVTPRNP